MAGERASKDGALLAAEGVASVADIDFKNENDRRRYVLGLNYRPLPSARVQGKVVEASSVANLFFRRIWFLRSLDQGGAAVCGTNYRACDPCRALALRAAAGFQSLRGTT